MYLTLTLHFANGSAVLADRVPITGNIEWTRDLAATPVIDEDRLFALTGISVKTTTVDLPTHIYDVEWTEADLDG